MLTRQVSDFEFMTDALNMEIQAPGNGLSCYDISPASCVVSSSRCGDVTGKGVYRFTMDRLAAGRRTLTFKWTFHSFWSKWRQFFS